MKMGYRKDGRVHLGAHSLLYILQVITLLPLLE